MYVKPRSIFKKKIALSILCLSMFFIIFEYFQWGLWDAKIYQTFSGCTETIYNFKKESNYLNDAVDRDIHLKETCLSQELHQRKLKAGLLSKHMKQNTLIFTKCGNVTPVLVSHTVSQQLPYNMMERYNTNPDKQNFKVPKIVHYISVGKWKFSFLNYLSFLSAYKHIKPWCILIHGDVLPFGNWWDKSKQEIPNMYHVLREIPQRIQGKKVRWLEHSTDVMRLQTLYDNGGIYLDTDVLILKSFDDLLKYDVTLGRESTYGLGSGIIISSPYSAFICLWKEGYRNYKPFVWNWATYAVFTPSKLAQTHPDLIHIEENTLQKPSWNEPELLFHDDNLFNWSSNYAIHVWKRFGDVPKSVEEIKLLNTTLGEVMRYIYYGSSKLVYENGTNTRRLGKKWKSHRKWDYKIAIDLVGNKILNSMGFNT